jgi:type IV pilus assembly protein PilA
MKKQSGFTLIELLLVLAIIGIISAIAIPALLSQRARARDKSSIANLTGMMSDGVGQWDKWKEAGSAPAAIVTHMGSYLTANHSADKSPWNGAAAAYATNYTTVTTATTQSQFYTKMTAPASMGVVHMYVQVPTSTTPGFHGGIVKLNGVVDGSVNFRKATAIE